MKTLGILFIIVAVVLGIAAFANSTPDSLETMQSGVAAESRKDRKEMEALNKFAEASGVATHEIDTDQEDEWRAKSADRRSEREQRLLFCAVPAGLLGITGLILVVSQRRSSPIPLPTVPRPTAAATFSRPPPPPNVGRGIYLHIAGEVTGPFTTAEVEEFLQDGSATFKTLCCIEGSEQWQPLSTLAS